MPPAKSAIWNRAEEIVHLLKEGWTLDRLAKHLRTIICAAASSPPQMRRGHSIFSTSPRPASQGP